MEFENNEYYITNDDVVNNTTFSNDDLGRYFSDVPKELKMISKSIYRLIYNYYRGAYQYDHIIFMRNKINNNNYEEQTFLMNAMIEQVKGAIHSGMDLNVYVNDKNSFPQTVYDELNSGRLLDASRKLL